MTKKEAMYKTKKENRRKNHSNRRSNSKKSLSNTLLIIQTMYTSFKSLRRASLKMMIRRWKKIEKKTYSNNSRKSSKTLMRRQKMNQQISNGLKMWFLVRTWHTSSRCTTAETTQLRLTSNLLKPIPTVILTYNGQEEE